MFSFHVSDHGPNYAQTVLESSASMSASIIVDYDGNLDDAQALPIGFPKDFCACAHVGFYGINGGNRSTRVRTEATLSVSDACIVSGPQVRESCDNPDSKFPIAGYSMSLVASKNREPMLTSAFPSLTGAA